MKTYSRIYNGGRIISLINGADKTGNTHAKNETEWLSYTQKSIQNRSKP